MNKYIVDTDDFEPLFKVDSIGVFGIGKSLSDSDEDHSWSRIKSVGEFEELNSDYINEHFGSLQDDAYQRGLDDAWEAASNISILESNGGLSWKEMKNIFGTDSPSEIYMRHTAAEAINKIKAYEEKQKADDKIEVGDEVIYNGTTKCIVVRPENDERYASLIESDGTHYFADHRECKKTGRHFDIASILEEMKHD